MTENIQIYITLALVVGFLGYLLWKAYKIWRKAYDVLLASGNELSQAVESWPRANATVLEAELEYDSSKEKLVPKVSWEYIYEGNKYHGSMLAPIQFINDSRKEMQRVVDFFSVGSTHKAYVNPKMHGVSYMFPKLESSKFFNSK